MLQQVIARLPPNLIRAVGRAQFRSPAVARAVRLVKGRLTGIGTIRHGAGAGLLFDASGGYPGYLLGTTEPEEQALLAEHVVAGGVFYDIGANIGFYSTIAARMVGPAGHVYAFEPYPDSAVRATHNATRNDFVNVTVVEAAVSDIESRMTLRLDEGAAKHRLADGPGIEVEAVALDQWIPREQARPPTFVMIDAEGAELDVLRGMLTTLAEHRPVVCCEVHWLGERFVDFCTRDLAALGYVVTNLRGGPLPLHGRWHAVLSPASQPANFSSSPSCNTSVWERERRFHDDLASQLDVDALAGQGEPDGLDLALLGLAGDVTERMVLDAGCGQGELTLRMLRQGAYVTALDVSPGMVEVVRRRAERFPQQARKLTTVAAPLEESGLADASFDLVLGRFILHHIDVDSGARELQRVLRPGGRAIFIENAGDNALLAFARDRLAGRWGIPRLGTPDEHPLTAADIDDLRRVFLRVTAHYPVFEFLVLFDRQVLRFRYPRVSRAIRRFDNAIGRLFPPLRRFSYRVIVELET
jgi:FkbM family methyltransferase